MPELTLIPSTDVTAHLPAAGQRAGADSGDPQLGVRSVPSAPGNVGIWECRPGGWPVVDRPDTEVAFILAGAATITDSSTGIAHEVAAGDLLVLPPGWSGRWDVHETVRKVYAIY